MIITWWLTWPGTKSSTEADGGASIGGAGSSVTITGDASGAISPGVMLAIDLSLNNTNDFDVAVDRLTVTVSEVDAPRPPPTVPVALPTSRCVRWRKASSSRSEPTVRKTSLAWARA